MVTSFVINHLMALFCAKSILARFLFLAKSRLGKGRNGIVLPKIGTMEKSEKSEKIEKLYFPSFINNLAKKRQKAASADASGDDGSAKLRWISLPTIPSLEPPCGPPVVKPRFQVDNVAATLSRHNFSILNSRWRRARHLSIWLANCALLDITPGLQRAALCSPLSGGPVRNRTEFTGLQPRPLPYRLLLQQLRWCHVEFRVLNRTSTRKRGGDNWESCCTTSVMPGAN